MMVNKGKTQEEKKQTVDILVEDVPEYLYKQIESASAKTNQTIREWIIGACHMRYINQFRDNLLYTGKGCSGGGSGSPVI